MKKYLFLCFFLIFSPPSISEEYLCSLELSSLGRAGEVEIKSFTRKGGFFQRDSQYGKSDFFIINETQSFIILGRKYSYPSLYVTMINKLNNEIYEHYLSFDDDKDKNKPKNHFMPLYGKCIIK